MVFMVIYSSSLIQPIHPIQLKPKEATMPTNDKMIGLSLSLCVSQIARGEVKEKNVEKIIAATNAPDLATFEEVLASYCKTYWHDYSEKAREIAMRFWNNGKIDQPRTRGEAVYFIGDGKWMDADQNTFHIVDGQRRYSGNKLRTW